MNPVFLHRVLKNVLRLGRVSMGGRCFHIGFFIEYYLTISKIIEYFLFFEFCLKFIFLF